MWQNYQRALALGHNKVVIPFTPTIVTEMRRRTQVPPIRFRRDYSALTRAIRVSALMHQRHRVWTLKGSVVADFQDYENARRVIEPTMSEIVGAVVSDAVQKIVHHIEEQIADGNVVDTENEDQIVQVHKTSSALIAKATGNSPSTVLRYINEAIDLGLLTNLAKYRHQGFWLAVCPPTEKARSPLPPRDELEEAYVAEQQPEVVNE